jgi:hypothetical protein
MENKIKEIGGYFSLELPEAIKHFHDDSLKLNSARNSFEYILNITSPKKVYMPYYNCSVMLEPLIKTKTSYQYYGIQEDLEIKDIDPLKEGEYILYINYFGIKEAYIQRLIDKYGKRLIIDNSQSFFSRFSSEVFSIYSPRKFFGVSDGGYLTGDFNNTINLEYDSSLGRIKHLIGRIEGVASDYYSTYKENDNSLKMQNIKRMSKTTELILSGIDYTRVADRRRANFLYLHSYLKGVNLLKIDLESIVAPMVYPFLTKENLKSILIKNKIYVATYWNDVLDIENIPLNEIYLTKNIIPLPIDQRYSVNDMKRMITIIKGLNNK